MESPFVVQDCAWTGSSFDDETDGVEKQNCVPDGKTEEQQFENHVVGISLPDSEQEPEDNCVSSQEGGHVLAPGQPQRLRLLVSRVNTRFSNRMIQIVVVSM